MSMSAIPSGWALARLPQLIAPSGRFVDGDWVESKDQDPEGALRLTQLADVGDGIWRNRSSRFMTHEKARELRCTILERGDVLVARMPDPLGRSCLFPGDSQDCVTVVDVCIVRPAHDGVSTRWLSHFINTPQFRSAIYQLQSGSTRKRISRNNLGTLELPVPPTTEQHRLADALESYLSRLGDAVATLERVQRNLKRYRASVLKAAAEGRLVPTEAELARAEGRSFEPASVLLERILAERRRRWEEAELTKMTAKGKVPKDDKWMTKYVEPVGPDTSELPELPEGWCWVSVGQLGVVSTGNTPPTNVREYYGADVPFVTPPDLDDRLVVNVGKGLTFLGAEVGRTVGPGAVLVCCIGSLGKVGLSQSTVAFNQQLNALEPAVSAVGRWFFAVAQSHGFRAAMEENSSATTVSIINKGRFEMLPVPLPPAPGTTTSDS